jgi:hypothetical protein
MIGKGPEIMSLANERMYPVVPKEPGQSTPGARLCRPRHDRLRATIASPGELSSRILSRAQDYLKPALRLACGSITSWIFPFAVCAQPLAPQLDISASDRSNAVIGLGSQPGFFYTWQVSSDLFNWTSQEPLFASSTRLVLTQSLALLSKELVRAKVNSPNTAVTTNYSGWTNVVLLNNGLVETVIVPSAGRVLQFRFLGATNGAFWENQKLYGQAATSASWNTEGSFGGDKSWPSPQSDWGWPPPAGFDGSPNEVSVTNGVAVMSTPEDPTYHIRVTRIVELKFNEPVMRIKTIFQRTSATTLTNRQLGTWVITQLQEPAGCYVPVPQPSIFPSGYFQLGSGMPAQFRDTNGVISFTRDTASAHKLGFDAGVMVWIGTNVALRIDAPRVPGLPASSFPDNGCSTEIYTNPGTNAPYVELESLGPLYLLGVGEQKAFVTTYTLFHRTQSDPDAEAQAILNRTPP